MFCCTHNVLLLVVIFLIDEKYASTFDIATACDGSYLKIECKEGYVINMIRALYGRYSIVVCNDNGATDWNVNCVSNKSTPIMQFRCGGQRTCNVQASSTLFEDPCPDTNKYLEVHYTCVSSTNLFTTTKAFPPWLATSAPSFWNNVVPKAITLPPEIIQPSISTSIFSTTSSTVTTQTNFEDISVPETKSSLENVYNVSSTTNTYFVTPPKTSSDFIVVPELAVGHLCLSTEARNLKWNLSLPGDTSIQPCPSGAQGNAIWKCRFKTDNTTVERFPINPDLSNCKTVWLSTLESRMSNGEPLSAIAGELSKVTDSESKTFFGGDIDITVRIIRDFASKIDTRIHDQKQYVAVVNDTFRSIVKTSSNVLDVSKEPSWNDLSHSEQMRIVTSLLIGLEMNAFILAYSIADVSGMKSVTHCTKNLLVSVQVLEMHTVANEIFPTTSVMENCSLVVNDWLQLQRSSLFNNSEGGLIRLVYMAFTSLERILKVKSANGEIVHKKINSKVLSASLGKGRHIELSKHVTLCFQHLQTENVSNPVCVFWDYTQENWSTEGCYVHATNKTHSICKCNHLTHFAIMVDVTSDSAIYNFSLTLRLLTITGIVLLVFIIVFVVFKINRKKNTVRTNIVSGRFKWFNECFERCYQPAPTTIEKSFDGSNNKDHRPSLYSVPPVASMATLDDERGNVVVRTLNTHMTSTLPKTYMEEASDLNLIGRHIPDINLKSQQHINQQHNNISYGGSKNGSIRRIKEARRREHLDNTLQYRKKAIFRCDSPKSNTYSEITSSGSCRNDSDPVYEEIERERTEQSSHQLSDISDEDSRRNSDMSRQSSKSYGDHRPLIPYNIVSDHNSHVSTTDDPHKYQLRNNYSGHTTNIISMLDGDTVVCHLQDHQHPTHQAINRRKFY